MKRHGKGAVARAGKEGACGEDPVMEVCSSVEGSNQPRWLHGEGAGEVNTLTTPLSALPSSPASTALWLNPGGFKAQGSVLSRHAQWSGESRGIDSEGQMGDLSHPLLPHTLQSSHFVL